MKGIRLAPSLMCADFKNLSSEIQTFDSLPIDCYHIDIMDGHFVPNYAMGLADLQAVSTLSSKLCDVHLMVSNPEDHFGLFIKAGAGRLTFHWEAYNRPQILLDAIKQKGVQAGIALNPETPVDVLKPLLPHLDYVIIMTVNPGFAGQKFIEETAIKVRQLKELSSNLNICVDGAISIERIGQLSALGAETFILGTSALFYEGSYEEHIQKIWNYLSSIKGREVT